MIEYIDFFGASPVTLSFMSVTLWNFCFFPWQNSEIKYSRIFLYLILPPTKIYCLFFNTTLNAITCSTIIFEPP